MARIKVKKNFIGSSISVKGLGRIKLREDHAPLLLRLGMVNYLDGITEPRKLVAKPKAKAKPKTPKADAPD